MFDADELRDVCLKAAGSDPCFATDDDLFDTVRVLATARAAFDAAELHVMGELETRDACDRQYGSGTASWVAHETRADRRGVLARVNVAAKLRSRLGEVDDALSEGRISLDHARAFATVANPRVIDELAEMAPEWIARAQDRPFRVWHHELVVWAELVDQDGPFDPNRDLARNQLSIRRLGGDGIVFRGELHGEHAVGFKQRVEARAEQLWDRAKADHAACPELEIPPYNTLLGLALEELTRDGNAAGGSASAPPVDVTLVLNADDPDVVGTVVDDFQLPAERVAHLLCDAQLTMVTTDVVGVLLNLGRTSRYANRAQRRALAHRDGGCVFPGCDAPARWCDAHHVQHWEHDGDTDMCNLALLCRHHHGVTHRNGWTMTATHDQRFVWTTPQGRTLTSQRHHGRPPPGT